MANDRETAAEWRRLEILKLLVEDPDYSINDILLQELLRERGLAVSMALLRADIAWLEEVNLVTSRELPGCVVAVLLNDGVDVVNGMSRIPGIARPRPDRA